MSIELCDLERNVPDSPSNHRAYLGVYCMTCGANPGEWCQRLNGRAVPLLRALHLARFKRLAALDKQGW